MATRNVTNAIVSLVMENGSTSTGKIRYKTMSIGRLSMPDYFPDQPDLDNEEQLAAALKVCEALRECVSLMTSEYREVVTSTVS